MIRFLLATLQIQALLEHNTKRDRRQALTQIPAGLADTYTATLQRIKRQSEIIFQRALLILTWVYYAERQLHVEELQHALAVKSGDTTFDKDSLPSKTSLVDCCLGLVVIEPETSTVRLTHFTLQEYFDNHLDALLPSGHAIIAETCLTYLSFGHAGKSREEIEHSSPFINYVGRQLGHHLRKGGNTMLDEKALALLHKEDKFYILERFMEYTFSTITPSEPLKTLPLHWAAFFGICSITRLLCNRDTVNAEDEPRSRTPLFYAAHRGHVEMVELLVNTSGVDINARDNDGRASLWAAADNGHGAVVQLLVNAPGVDVNVTDKKFGDTPLSRAARWGYDAVVQLLVNTPGVDVNARGRGGLTPFWHAVILRHDAVVQLLFNTPGVDIDVKNSGGETPLHEAARHGFDAIVRLLVNAPGVDINARDKYSWTPLSIAAYNKQHVVVQMLVNTPAVNINARNNYDRTPLYLAAFNGCHATVQLLVNIPGVDVNARDIRNRTPLWAAAFDGNDAVVQVLVNNPSVDINARSSDGRTPLQAAAYRGHKAIVQLLINTPGVDVSGIDINTISDKNGQRLFPEAISEDYGSVSTVTVDNQEFPTD